MHWVEVDGYPLPKRYGGHPALDFCNTWAGWDVHGRKPGSEPDPRREWLATYDRLSVWSRHAGLLTAETVRRLRSEAEASPDEAKVVLSRAHRLRELLYRLALEPTDPVALDGFAPVAQAALRATVLRAEPDGTVRRVLPDAAGLALPLLAVARAGEDLLTAEVRRPVRACPGEGCGWLFLDLRGRRRWCDMASCGNRAKVRAHAARQPR